MAGHDSDSDATVLIDVPASWETYLASAIGADHVRAGTPNQDAIAATKFEFPDAPGLLAFAVADGHGHARHFRSDRGSKLGVKAGVSAARSWARHLPAGEPISQVAASQLVIDVVTTWRELVAADLAQDPLSDAQLATLPPGDPAEIPYGATLLLAVLRPDVAVLAQIGDGEMLIVLPDGRHLSPIPTDIRLDGIQTTSLCQPDAVSAFRVALVNLTKTQAFAVFAATDGYGNAQAEVDWQEGVAADLVRMGSEYGLEWIGSQLSGWAALCASSNGSGDDSTVALALNSTAVLVPPARRQPRSVTDPFHDDQTLPNLRSLEADRTLTLRHESRDDDETKPSAAVRSPGYALPGQQPLAPTLPAQTLPPPGAKAGSGYGPSFAAAKSAVAQRPALWLGAVIIAVLAIVAVVLLFLHGHSGRSPAFRPNPVPTHSSGRPTHQPTASPTTKPTTTPTASKRGRRTATPSAKATTSPTSGSHP